MPYQVKSKIIFVEANTSGVCGNKPQWHELVTQTSNVIKLAKLPAFHTVCSNLTGNTFGTGYSSWSVEMKSTG